jgi:hypothetical protein
MSRLYYRGCNYQPYGHYRAGCGRIWGLVVLGIVGFGCIKAYSHHHGYYGEGCEWRKSEHIKG